MKANVTFKLGDVEISTPAGVSQLSSIQGAGRDNMTINNAISKMKNDTGIDLIEVDERIKAKATVNYY